MEMIDRFAYCQGTALFWSEYHSGQNSRGYSILSRILSKFNPGPMGMIWEHMEDEAREVYRAWCRKEGEKCEYDSVLYAIEQSERFNTEDPCTEYFLERFGDENIDETALLNYEHSDFINNDMCYTKDLLRFYEQNEDSVLQWCDEYCEALGCTSRLEMLAGQTIEAPDDFAAALVNAGMTYLAGEMLRTIQDS